MMMMMMMKIMMMTRPVDDDDDDDNNNNNNNRGHRWNFAVGAGRGLQWRIQEVQRGRKRCPGRLKDRTHHEPSAKHGISLIMPAIGPA